MNDSYVDFLLFGLEQNDGIEQFVEIYDFRNIPSQNAVSRWSFLQPKDVAWNPKDGLFIILFLIDDVVVVVVSR